MGRPPGTKNARVNETRSADNRNNNQRQMPTSAFMGRLYIDPNEIPQGITYAWIDIGTVSAPNDENWQMKSSDGWVPVPRNRHPKYARGSLLPGRQSDPYADVIVRGGLLLCEKSSAEVDAAKEACRAIAMQRYQKVSEWRSGEGSDPLMPRFDNSSAPEFGAGVKFKND